jgi:L-arabinose isomerase
MRGGNIQTTSKQLGHSPRDLNKSQHLCIFRYEHVRQELGITTAHLLGTFVQESKVDRLVREIEQLSEEEKESCYPEFKAFYFAEI